MTSDRLCKAASLASAAFEGLGAGLWKRPIVFIDIGGRGGLSRPWRLLWRLGLVRPVFFEPDPDAAATLRRLYPKSIILQCGAWSSAGEQTLWITAELGCSSLLTPSPDPRLPDAVRRMLPIERQLAVRVKRAEAALTEHAIIPEIVKIDTQGSELDVLKGFGGLLADVSCVEMEVSFLRCYEASPLFDEVYAFMIDNGFGLFDLQVFGVRGTRNGVQANAFFCRRSQASERQLLVESLFRKANAFPYRA